MHTVNSSRSAGRRVSAVTVAALALAGGGVSAAGVGAAGATRTPLAHGYPAVDVTFSGHGWGPGVGMGQWGAFGYGEQYHEAYTWILGHFYGGTTAGAIGDPTIRVAITEDDGYNPAVTSGATFTVAGQKVADHRAARMVLEQAGTGKWQVEVGASCGTSSWSKAGGLVANPVAVPSVTSPGATSSQVLTLCRADGVNEPMRGDVQAIDHGGSQRTIDVLPLEQYLRGVVPSEMPASWGTFGSAGPQSRRWGFQALEAQAVAARSYADAYFTVDGGWSGYADICDSYCQSYPGMTNENPVSDAAVADTAGQIRLLAGTKTAATTEYSASTGGYTAGGPFAAQPDAGDAICLQSTGYTCNPNHDWKQSIPVGVVESAFPSIGSLQSVVVTKRNGLGDLGGRVLDVEVSGSAGSVSVSGWTFSADIGLLSDWFAVTNGPGGQQSGLHGYWLASANGVVEGFGSAASQGSLAKPPRAPVVSMTTGPRSAGYWLVGADGAIYPFGAAVSHGSMAGSHLNKPIVGMAATPDDGGYWLDATDGGIFTFGDAHFYGSKGGSHLNKPIDGMAATPDGKGYWLVASDGGIFTFGDAHFYGSKGGSHLNKPIVGMAATPDGKGYLLVASDGGIFTFGDARFEGSLGGTVLAAPATAMIPTPDRSGYEILTSDGGVHPFGTAPQFGDFTSRPVAGAGAIVGIAGAR